MFLKLVIVGLWMACMIVLLINLLSKLTHKKPKKPRQVYFGRKNDDIY